MTEQPMTEQPMTEQPSTEQPMTEQPSAGSLSKGAQHLAREAAYVAVGLGVLGVQRAQTHRAKLTELLDADGTVRRAVSELTAKALGRGREVGARVVHLVAQR